MADRRTDDAPLAPRRPLTGSREGQTKTGQTKTGETKTGQAKTGQAKTGQTNTGETNTGESSRRPVAERVTQRVSGAVASATESVKSAAESRRSEERKPSTPPAAKRPGGTTRPRTRKARLRMIHVDPWSVMKTAFLLSIAVGIVTVIAVAMVWSVLGAAGVWDSINTTVQEVIGGESGNAFDVEDYVGTGRVIGFTMIVAVVDVVLITAIATLGAFLYNLAATLLGGLEITLAEEEH